MQYGLSKLAALEATQASSPGATQASESIREPDQSDLTIYQSATGTKHCIACNNLYYFHGFLTVVWLD